MEKKLGSSFKKVKAKCYKEHKDGFYVYDGENITFHYNWHEDDQLVVETIPVMDFITRLIQHIPEKHFKQIRYYGLYARTRENDKKIISRHS